MKTETSFINGSMPDIDIKKAWVCGAIIITLALALRVYQLGDIHSGFFADEAVNAYDSFSILKAGKNLWGEPFPFFFNHHNVDTVSGIYIYSSVPFIYIFGINEFSARLAAAVYGTLTVLVVFIFTRQVFKNNLIALTVSLLLAISPWHILYSRVAIRGITLPFFFVAGLYFLLRGHSQVKNSILSGLLLGVTIYTYSVVKLFLPLFLVGYLFVYRKELYQYRKNVLISVAVFLLVALPALKFTISESGKERFKDISIFSQKNVEQKRKDLEMSDSPARYLAQLPDIGISGIIFAKNYLTFYTPRFLFSKEWQWVGHPHLLYWFELPFILLGVFLLMKQRRPEHKIILWWFIIYCIPTSLTVPGTSPHRAINGLPVFQIIAAYGIYHFFGMSVIRERKRLIAVAAMFIVVVLQSLYSGLHHQFSVYPKKTGEHWQFGFRDAISYTESVKSDYEEVVFSENLHNAYALLLFYLKYDPNQYLSNKEMRVHKTPQNIWLRLHEIDKYKIKDIEDAYRLGGRRLYVVKPWELKNIEPKKIIYYPDGTPAMKII